MEKSLWGNLNELMDGVKNPKEILEEQSAYLLQISNGLVRCDICRVSLNDSYKAFYEDLNVKSDFSFSFRIVSDYVKKYEYEICKLTYGIKMYPMAISFGTDITKELKIKFFMKNISIVESEDTIVVEDEGQFLEALQEILSSNGVRQVLKGLLAIAKSEAQELPF